MTYEPKHAGSTEVEELTYDPYAKVVINASENFYDGVQPKIVEAHEATSAFRNDRILTQKKRATDEAIEKVRQYLVENYDDLELHADEIARLLDVELTNEVKFSVTATFDITATLPIGLTVDSLSQVDFDLSIQPDYGSDIDIQDYDWNIDDITETY